MRLRGPAEAASQAALTGLARCFQERCQVRLRCPARWRGPRWAWGGVPSHSYTNTCPRIQVTPVPFVNIPHIDPGACQLGPLAINQLSLPVTWRHSSSEWGSPACCLLSILLLHSITREQVRGPRGSYSFLPVCPSPLTPWADRWEQPEGTAEPGHLSPPSQSGPHGPAVCVCGGGFTGQSAWKQAAVGAGAKGLKGQGDM